MGARKQAVRVAGLMGHIGWRASKGTESCGYGSRAHVGKTIIVHEHVHWRDFVWVVVTAVWGAVTAVCRCRVCGVGDRAS